MSSGCSIGSYGPCSPRESGLRRLVVSQFGHPRGRMGWLIGNLMAVKNRQRSEWVISLMGVRDGEAILEAGFGSGMDLRRVSEINPAGFIAGVDASAVMVRMATKRNRRAIEQGRMSLTNGTVERLPFAEESFDLAFSINSVQFWPEPSKGVEEIRRVLRTGGRIAIGLEPRNKGATRETTQVAGRELLELIGRAGFRDVRMEISGKRPVPTACVLGVK